MKTSIIASLAIATLAAASPQRPANAPAGPWPTADSSAYSEFQSWTSAASLTAWPTASSQWASVTSAHPLPTGLSSYASSWSSLWTATGTGAWGPGITDPAVHGGPGGWHGGAGGHGPFGGANGWGQGPWNSNGDWTTGAWTSWWGTGACPPSTWPGKSRSFLVSFPAFRICSILRRIYASSSYHADIYTLRLDRVLLVDCGPVDFVDLLHRLDHFHRRLYFYQHQWRG
jgi:hypothetical protein